MKKILFAILSIISISSFADERIATIKPVFTENQDGTVNVAIEMDDNFDVTGVSFRLYLPEGITLAKNGHVTISEGRDPNGEFSKNITNTKDGAKQISAVSPNGIPFEGDKGVIMNITLTLQEGLKRMPYKFNFKKISFTDKDAVSSTMADFESEFVTVIEGVQVTSENESSPMYNLAGQRVSRVQKGIFIQNGKKVLK